MKNNVMEILQEARKNNSGATLKNYERIQYPNGYQYSITENSSENATPNIEEAARMVEKLHGNCGIWYSDGLFYIETSYWCKYLETALDLASAYHQKSIYCWAADTYINL